MRLDLLCILVQKSEGHGLLVWEIVIKRANPGTATLGDSSHRCGLIADLWRRVPLQHPENSQAAVLRAPAAASPGQNLTKSRPSSYFIRIKPRVSSHSGGYVELIEFRTEENRPQGE